MLSWIMCWFNFSLPTNRFGNLHVRAHEYIHPAVTWQRADWQRAHTMTHALQCRCGPAVPECVCLYRHLCLNKDNYRACWGYLAASKRKVTLTRMRKIDARLVLNAATASGFCLCTCGRAVNPSSFGAPRKTESTGIRGSGRKHAPGGLPTRQPLVRIRHSDAATDKQYGKERVRGTAKKKMPDAARTLPQIGAIQDASEQLTFTKSSRCTPPASPGMLASAPAPRPPGIETRQEQAPVPGTQQLVLASTSMRARACAGAQDTASLCLFLE
jgi:hypothetical protein